MHSECARVENLRKTTPASAAKAARWVGAAVAAPCLGVLLVALWLTPKPSGMGTHEELGLPPCSTLARTGLPCPSCGLTTSFANMAHGRVPAAIQAHPFGPVLFLATCVFALAGLVQAVTARPALAALRPRFWWALAALGGMLAGWALTLYMGLSSGRLPLR